MAEPKEPKAAPLMNAIAQEGPSGFVIVEVGSERQQYHLHTALLTHHSDYFRTALNGRWKEASDKIVTLADVEPGIFGIFVDWLYTGAFPETSDDLETIKGHSEEDLDDDPYVTAMVKAYVLGHRFLAAAFRRAVNNRVVDYVDCHPFPPWFFAATFAFDNLPAEDDMLRFLVDIHCRYWVKVYENENAVLLRARLPPAFLHRVMHTYSEKVRENPITWWNHDLRACDYHQHSSEEERKSCGQEE